MSKRRVPPAPRGDRRRSRRSGGSSSSQGNVREAAAFVVERTLQTRSTIDAFLGQAMARCDTRDHALLNELVLGTVRWLRRLDSLIEASADRPTSKIEPAILNPLRVAAYQLFFLDRIPDHAVVHEAVDQVRRATHRGGAGFANGVLRRLGRNKSLDEWPVQESDPIKRLAIELSHPDFLVERWWQDHGEVATRKLMNANNRPKPLHLLAFKDRGGRENAAEALIEAGVTVEPSAMAPYGLKVRSGNPFQSGSFEEGNIYVQDEASQLAALMPPPNPGDSVIDLAAAPGGKTFSLLAFEPTLKCTMSDRSGKRLSQVRENLARLNREVPLVVADARDSAFGGTFDRVVLDLPCSGTGTLRKHPEIRWRISPEEFQRMSRESLAMLKSSAEVVKPGGVLISITCSVEKDENEQVVEAFLADSPGFSRVPEGDLYPCGGRSGTAEDGLWRLFPGGDHDGFTVQALYRRSG